MIGKSIRTIIPPDRQEEEDEMKNGMEAIERNARVQAQIIDDLLDMSRIMSGKVRLELERMDLGSIVTEAIETVSASATAKGVGLQRMVDAPELVVSGDPNRLRQVFWNLLTNAIKFTPKGGRVRVTSERVDSHVEVSVVDTGEGIPAEFLPYMFSRFQQADASTTRRHGGLGLGLSIVKQLVELHGGSVHAESERLLSSVFRWRH
jgi:signal transduction histidine kinase